MSAATVSTDTTTTYSMDFDFSSDEQRKTLEQLQEENYYLLAYKGASGPGQVTAGLPTWISMPFANIFGQTAITYHPEYYVYVSRQVEIAVGTVIEMNELSSLTPLGSGLEFKGDGEFVSNGSAPAGTINLLNSSQAPVTVGLACAVSPSAQSAAPSPFCAFTLNPAGSISMEPHERVAMMAAQLDLQSGNVQANASAPGSSLIFDSQTLTYQLMVLPVILDITNQPGTTATIPLSSGETLSFLNAPVE